MWQVTKVTCRSTVLRQLKVHQEVTTLSLSPPFPVFFLLSLTCLSASFLHLSLCLCLFKPVSSHPPLEPFLSSHSHYSSLSIPLSFLSPSFLPRFLTPSLFLPLSGHVLVALPGNLCSAIVEEPIA